MSLSLKTILSQILIGEELVAPSQIIQQDSSRGPDRNLTITQTTIFNKEDLTVQTNGVVKDHLTDSNLILIPGLCRVTRTRGDQIMGHPKTITKIDQRKITSKELLTHQPTQARMIILHIVFITIAFKHKREIASNRALLMLQIPQIRCPLPPIGRETGSRALFCRERCPAPNSRHYNRRSPHHRIAGHRVFV